ncbi:MAG: sugar transferase [Bacteroidales bacterium]|nr:sugar transferase [Bacteroidales bacterium]
MAVKYLFDRVASFLGLLILWPVMLIVALLIRVKMGNGGILFKQQRIGKNGEAFTIVKFRTMEVNHHGSSVSVAGESRITKLGAVLRKYKLDELPELWNVFKGEMSFVGPRPDVPGYADRLQGEERRILILRPGITGPASLKYRNEEEMLAAVDDPQRYNDEIIYPDKVRLNLYYLDNYSFLMDIRLIVATVLGRRIRYAGEVI